MKRCGWIGIVLGVWLCFGAPSVYALGQTVSFGVIHNFIDTETSEQNVGVLLEIWPSYWIATGGGKERRVYITDDDTYRRTAVTNLFFTLRLTRAGFYLFLAGLESEQSVDLIGSENDFSKTHVLNGGRVSIGYMVDLGFLLLTLGGYQDSLAEATESFSDGSEATLGGVTSGPEASILIAF